MYKIVPTYIKGEWSTTEFEELSDFIEYILSIFSEPGLYGFTDIAYKFNSEAPQRIKDFIVCDVAGKAQLLTAIDGLSAQGLSLIHI